MKTLFFILLSSLASAQQGSDTKDIIELPIEFVAGYGPFDTIRSFWVHTWDEPAPGNPWEKTDLKVNGLPDYWSEIRKQRIEFDSKQFAYQNYKAGKIDEQFFNRLIREWNIDLSKRKYSDQPIRCFAYLIMGKTRDGDIRYMVDTNNDLDFSDEVEQVPVLFEADKRSDVARLASEAKMITYERMMNERVEEVEVPVLVMKLKKDWLMHNIPQYAKALYNGKEISICSDAFNSTSYDNSTIAVMDLDEPKLIAEGEIFVMDKQQYKNLGVSISSRVLKLQKVQENIDIFLPQIGFKAPSFSGTEFTSNKSIRLDDFSGKFLYIEFWGSWCAPCIKELPHLKRAYSQLDSLKISFLGFAYQDDPERLRKLIEKEGIKWPQILTKAEDGIVEEYIITGYPTSLLIDPEGKIIAKNLRGENLMSDISKYINNWHVKNIK